MQSPTAVKVTTPLASTQVPLTLTLTARCELALALGGLLEVLIIRRFFRAPRLILTVATIGIAQMLTGAALLLPRWFNSDALATRLQPPFTAHLSLGGAIFDANDLLTAIVVPVAFVLLALFLAGEASVVGFGVTLPTLGALAMLWPSLRLRERMLTVMLAMGCLMMPIGTGLLARLSLPLSDDAAPFQIGRASCRERV